jgi:hypothetical protein
MSTLPPQPPPYFVPASRQSVVVTDVDMSIAAMCRFMIKWAIAAIPAFMILWLSMFVGALLLALVFHGASHLSRFLR